ncbi:MULTISPECIES: DeoR/GlpR family DNA-binding transcription regulator [unclassified Imperialibacter]|uniref:DeoR/GlpR family DNA-binding transcription regulator n=1 Tax=unclassified Imperialibacter TaxID=2629706 RepID=UPI001250D482|nr:MULTISPECIES: DeoR/GlpR family DNA-binding transcription regulator [unclassified Imperialibacter]CAD5250646.1 Transcriptional regulator, DeoR family [Imperialibacter sp. 75]CAD5286204.1 Transcriptional regulator, DeoR family [Imperialibacter sp. 89]VVT05356.1 Transcriptional regulator, DeoR family [Imperialibacter sp. EC-SDR9]
MSSKARQKGILEQLKAGEESSVRELATLFDTSDITIRRDLVVLSEKGLLVRTHGGAMLPESTGFHQKESRNNEAKGYIGKLAASCVEPNDVIFMDCGSTVFQMCAHLRKLERLTIITNSLPIVSELLNHPGFTINLIGGEIDIQRRAVHGSMALEHIARYKADKAFVGVDGVSLANGLSAASEKEASITLAMAHRAEQTYLLCDASKLEKDAYLQFAGMSLIDSLVSDRGISPVLAARYEQAGIHLIR